jgi:hypothetical protein
MKYYLHFKVCISSILVLKHEYIIDFGIFVDSQGNQTRKHTVEWSRAPLEIGLSV